MENLLFVLIFVILVLTIFLMYLNVKKLKKMFLRKHISQKFADKYVFNTLIIEDICNYILRQSMKRQKKILKELFSGNLKSFYKQIENENIKQKINLCDNKKSKADKADNVYILTLAKCLLKENKHDDALILLQSINLHKATIPQKAYYQYLMAQLSVFEGDLLTASEDVNTTLKFFKKKNMLFEEAECYFILGTIYRISGVYDTADLMLRASQEIYEHIGSSKGEAEVFGTLGLLMSAQNRFDEAESYYQKALKKAVCDKKLTGFILSQQAMLEMVKGCLNKSLKTAEDTLKKTADNNVKATVFDIMSRINLSKKKYSSAIRYAEQAFDIFFKAKNYPSAYESLYIKASALTENKKFDESEKVLRYLIESEKKHKSCFHIASAYTLLGLVLMKKNEPERAKAIFNQALSKELCNDRQIGVAIDYANLALVEKQQGHIDEAQENLKKALKLAEDSDTDLINKIKTILD